MSDTMLKIGDLFPKFELENQNGELITNEKIMGEKTILYFYPRDNTPTCTTEACDFRDNSDSFADKNAIVIGISRDSLKSHAKFIEKFNLPFVLLSDEKEEVCNLFNVIKEKNMYGKKVMGIERSTFIINEEGILVKEYRKVKVKEHVNTVLEDISSL